MKKKIYSKEDLHNLAHGIPLPKPKKEKKPKKDKP